MRFWKWTVAATVFLAVLTGCATATHNTASAAREIRAAASQPAAVTTTCAAAPTGHASTAGADRCTNPEDADTLAHHFTPFTASGKLRVAVAGKARGYCWETSLAAPGTTKFRCLSGNTILDPCFVSSAHATTAACVAGPWSGATVLTLTKKLPRPDVVPVKRPWAIRLSNGARCVAGTGTAAFVHGQNLDYICSNGDTAGLLNPSAKRIVAAYAKPTATSFSRVAVAALWRT
jgi:hypothetical protein